MVTAAKAQVTLGGAPLAGTTGVAWRLVSGVAPYTATFVVDARTWRTDLKAKVGRPLPLQIVDSRNVITNIKDVYILHTVPSDSPSRVAFVVADKRWKWQYELVVRDYNIPRKTGDRTANFQQVPVQTRQVVDVYDYLAYSLDRDRRWTAKRALEDTLSEVVDRKDLKFESFPIRENSSAGQFAIQNVILRDAGNVAVSRMLSLIPGADVYVDLDGKVVVYDASNLEEAERHLSSLPPSAWGGDHATFVDRKVIRPKRVRVHYQREIEVVFNYSDDYGGTRANPGRDTPFLQNVLPTVDPETTITEYDPELGEDVQKVVPPGTWVSVDKWLTAMDADRPAGSLPWTFATIRRHWLKGDLDGVLGARGLDLDGLANISQRVQTLKQHFRQTFRVSRRYMERIRSLRAVRVALIDPVTGARAPAAVWGQACIIPSTKGKYMAARADEAASGVFRNVDYLAPSAAKDLIETTPGPARVNIVDADLGIFRVEWILSPYGTEQSYVPCHLVGDNDQPAVPVRDFRQQDTAPMGAQMQVESGTNGIFLRNTLDMKVMMTIVPSSPNSEKQFHIVDVEARDIAKLFRKTFRIQSGKGPDLELFVTPGEATARFAWKDDIEAALTIEEVLGLRERNDDRRGAEPLPGYVLINSERHLTNHARALGAEALANFADSVQGTVLTTMPREGMKLKGGMSSATVRVATAPSAKVDVAHQFPGQQRPVSRFSLLSDDTRSILLGVIPYPE